MKQLHSFMKKYRIITKLLCCILNFLFFIEVGSIGDKYMAMHLYIRMLLILH